MTAACSACNRKAVENGICASMTASDGRIMRCVGPWSRDKHYYLRRYINIFTTAMRDKFAELNYVDLFCGAGVCWNRESGVEEDGSPLIAVSAKHPFTRYFFGDIDPACIQALRARCAERACTGEILYFTQDCSTAVPRVRQYLAAGSLTLAFVDPTGIDVTLDSIRQLSQDRRVDLILNMPFGMDINRNRQMLLKSHQVTKMDQFLPGWREACTAAIRAGDVQVLLGGLLDVLATHLVRLGYVAPSRQDCYLIRTAGAQGTKLYYLAYASKHPLGYQFWRKVGGITPARQRTLPL